MKDGFKTLQIEPAEGYLDFIGPAKVGNDNGPTRVLKGEVKFILTKPVKIRNMSVKFKGFSQITLKEPFNTEISTPLLPKLKLILFGKTTLPAGNHAIPWEIDIPNIYPRSLSIKRASINYKVIVSISLGLTKTTTAEYPIVIRRHLIPYKELAPIIETKLLQKTIPGKFHYEIDTPQIICLEQEFIPLAIKYISFANHKSVQSIRTRLIQIELYRRQSPSRSETDLSTFNKDMLLFEMDAKTSERDEYNDSHARYIKKTVPAIVHSPDNISSAWKKPCIIRHKLHPYLAYTLNSPLITIYHQIEVTFQFGMRYEEIKEKLPIIIASIPSPDASSSTISSHNDIMMCYAFEENLKNDYLPSRYDARESGFVSIDDDPNNHNDDVHSILRDTSMLPSIDNDEGATNGRTTPMPISNPYKPPNTLLPPRPTHLSIVPSPSRRHLLLPNDMSMHNSRNNGALKKYASACDLSSVSQDAEQIVREYEDLEERPRTTTPTMRRHQLFKKTLQPINIELANRNDPVQFPKERPMHVNHTNDSSSSDVLPAVDRNIILSQTSLNQINKPSNNIPSNGYRKHRVNVSESIQNGNLMDDLQSLYSHTSASSGNAPSLSSSATLSTSRSHPTLHSRPPSPVFSPAPGLPATIPLRRQEQRATQIEEMFFESSGAMSPAMNTVASSTLLSPRTTRSLRNRIALSTISSLTNDSLCLGSSSFISYTRGRASSTVDPDVQNFLINQQHNNINDMESYYPPPDRYINAKLPPIPTQNITNAQHTTSAYSTHDPNDTNAHNKSKRLTKVYLEDSDEEVMEDEVLQLPAIPVSASYLPRDISTPPKLPRLSFGNDFGTSLGIDIL